jgi:ribonucleoside-diphosphate reductase alpha chain
MTSDNIVPDDVKIAFIEAKKYFPTPLQEFQLYDKYSRFNYEKGRRETWIETVDRSVNYLKKLSQNKLDPSIYQKIRDYILTMKSAPSMRLLAMAGPAAERNNASIFNCSYLPLDSITSLVEELLIALAGCGVGYSVEKQYIDQFPTVKLQTGKILPTFVIPDTTEGWAEALKTGLETWFNGDDINFDYSLIRRAGSPLKIKGGRSSGPGPIRSLLDFTKKTILSRQGTKLHSLNVHDIACKVGESIVAGGVRRSALICLFDMNDEEMLNCKNGDLRGNQQRWMANNSAVWNEELPQDKILTQMYEMFKGKRGEPGIFSRYNANKIKPKRRDEAVYGSNPCGEINLRPFEFCNLSVAIARPDDTLETLADKVEVAAIIGTIQAMATNFTGLRPIWKKNCDEERLLGVDINGWVDTPLLVPKNPDLAKNLQYLKERAIETNKKYAEILGINRAAAVTCVKPSGNSALLFNCSSGIHPRHYRYYIRNVRVQAESPLRKLFEKEGVPMHPENGQIKETANTWVVHFPIRSPEHTITKREMSAVEQCEYWLAAKINWTEHNPSVTITYTPTEIIDLIKWVDDHKKYIGGMSFLPLDDAQYDQMPYEPITREEYEEKIKNFPSIDYSKLYLLEKSDFTTVAQEVACTSGVCSLDEYQAKEVAKKFNLI